MERALGSEPEARALFGELAACARDGQGVESARALCAVNAARLAEAHPEALGADYRALRAGLADELLQSVEASGY